jgi:murein L,D-transpeptidase YcbB/YkuD
MVTRLLLVVAAALVISGCNRGAEQREQVQATLRLTLAGKDRPPYVTADAEGKRLWKLTRQFYEGRLYAPAWIEGTKPRAEMEELVRALHAATNEGLDPQLYSVSMLAERTREATRGFLTKKGFKAEEAGALDVLLTYLYMKYASDLADGLSDLAHADRTWQIKPEKFDPAAHLAKALDTSAIEQSLVDLTPENPQYRELRTVLLEYRQLAANGGWPALPANLRLKPGQHSPHVGILAKRLAASGDYSESSAPARYDGKLVEAVKRVQRRHGLADDGVIGAAVVAEMNVPIDHRIRQIALNLERWRWLPRDLGQRFILVNIPEYRLEVWEGSRVPLTMKVVVGKKDTPTPIFNDEMTHVVFSPYWNVPPAIAEGETLPEVLNDPGFLERMDMEVLDASGNPVDPLSLDLDDPAKYRFRQRPGAQNALGLVKFMFPNQHNVYLHDTPADSLFARATRSFSHGCVRVEQPLEFAEYVLRDQPEWTRERIQQAMHAGEERTVKLREAIPVYLGYWTARVAADGVMQFRPDVYGVDKRLTVMLAERLGRLRKSAAAAAMATTMPAPQTQAGVTHTAGATTDRAGRFGVGKTPRRPQAPAARSRTVRASSND